MTVIFTIPRRNTSILSSSGLPRHPAIHKGLRLPIILRRGALRPIKDRSDNMTSPLRLHSKDQASLTFLHKARKITRLARDL